MDLWTSIVIHSVFIFLYIRSAHNNVRQYRTLFDSGLEKSVRINSEQFIIKYGYTCETHSVITEDGYIVKLFRIPRNGPPVFLVHGLADSSDSWLSLGPTNSLAYLLSNAGFDVWLYNARGNKYSKRHTRNLSSKRYWNFSYEELGSMDLPACIDYILKTTSRLKLSYIGFSQGTTIFFVMCSMRPEYNEKIKHAVLLAPVAWTTGLQYPFINILVPNLEKLVNIFESAGLYELFSDNILINYYHAKVCNVSSHAKILCELEYYITFGLRNISFLLPEKLPVITSHIPAGVSIKSLVHFMQGYITKKFQRYNYYKPNQNYIAYGSSEPPEYNMSLVSVPITLFSSETDWYSSFSDVQTMKKSLPNIVDSVFLNKSMDFNHLEFIYGSRVKTLINEPIVKLLSLVNKY